jgi:hypothetical protein
MMPYEYIVNLIVSGVKFKYLSYDHRAAVEELKGNPSNLNVGHLGNHMFSPPEEHWIIPDEIKQNHLVWRTGKIRDVSFNPNGKMFKFRIGARRAKAFYLSDFGVNVKPIIFKSDDNLNLINQGLAIEDKI